MNLDEMNTVWNSSRNRPSDAEQQQRARRFTRQLIRRRRFQAIWLTNTFVWLTLVTLWLGQAMVAGKFSFAQEWAVLPLVIAPWLVALHFLRRYLKPVSPLPDGNTTMADSLRAALTSNQTERAHLKLVATLLAGLIPFVAVAVHQLHAVGKVSPREQACMALFFGGALAAGMLGVAVRYFGRLTPQARSLNALLSEMGN
jgi:hypothetical protein